MSLASVLGPEFSATPSLFFGPTGSTPRPPATPPGLGAAAVGARRRRRGPLEDLVPEAIRGEAILPISEAAVEAARTPGTEVDGTEIGGSARGARGRWVQLRRRRRQPESDVETPQRNEPEAHRA